MKRMRDEERDRQTDKDTERQRRAERERNRQKENSSLISLNIHLYHCLMIMYGHPCKPIFKQSMRECS